MHIAQWRRIPWGVVCMEGCKMCRLSSKNNSDTEEKPTLKSMNVSNMQHAS